jgi:hypothetical protein
MIYPIDVIGKRVFVAFPEVIVGIRYLNRVKLGKKIGLLVQAGDFESVYSKTRPACAGSDFRAHFD